VVETLTIKDDYIFLASDTSGEVKPGWQGHGLYFEDTRYLSQLELTVNNQTPQTLDFSADYNISASFHLSSPYQAQVEAAESTISPAQTAIAHAIGVVRHRFIKDGLCEQLEFTNYHSTSLAIEVTLRLSADFADIFEVRGFSRQLQGDASRIEVQQAGQYLKFYSVPVKAELPVRQLSFQSSLPPTQYLEGEFVSPINGLRVPQISLNYHLNLAPGQPIILALTATPKRSDSEATNSLIQNRTDFVAQVATSRQNFHDWETKCSQVETNDYLFNRLMRISTLDLRSLMQRHDQQLVVTAGLPWYFSLFGRDSLITAMQCLSLNPQIAIDTLRVLALYQGTKVDEWRDEAPGKILHELRQGDMTRSGEMPHGPYYGSVDSTLLFIWCFARTLKWTNDAALFAELWPSVQRALDWAKDYGEEGGQGYIRFSRRSSRGILHQGWKDSDESMGGSFGPRPPAPLALVEVQGYYYAALVEVAQTLRQYGNPAQQVQAATLAAQAAELKARFNQDFWWQEEAFFVQALDGKEQQVRNITSNPGHCLWSGIIAEDKAAQVVARLMQPDLLSGWGIRTISTFDSTYNPMSYHNGSIWPHDNSLIVAGFRRYGFDQEAMTLLGQLLDAATTFPDSRLPELFCGFPRSENGIEENSPVAYSVSCSPQAWAAGSAPLLIQTMLGLDGDAFGKTLKVNPLLPKGITELNLTGLRVGKTRLNLAFRRDQQTGRVEIANSPKFLNDSEEIKVSLQ